MKQAMKATGTTTKKAAVEASLRLTVQLKEQAKIRDLFGKVEWEGDLDAMREGRFVNWDEDIEKEKLKDPAA
jgi:Arc/MetJ family transcription regulator